MKKKYEDEFSIFIASFISILIFFILVVLAFKNKFNKYTSIPANHIIDNAIEVILTTEELKYIEKNNYIYYRSKKEKVEIVSVIKNAYKNKKRCHQIILRLKLKEEKTNLIYISIYNKKEKFIKLLNQFWKE